MTIIGVGKTRNIPHQHGSGALELRMCLDSLECNVYMRRVKIGRGKFLIPLEPRHQCTSCQLLEKVQEDLLPLCVRDI